MELFMLCFVAFLLVSQIGFTLRKIDTFKAAKTLGKRLGGIKHNFNVFVKTVIKEEKISFELSARERDDFYNEANIRHLEELKRLDDGGSCAQRRGGAAAALTDGPLKRKRPAMGKIHGGPIGSTAYGM